MATEMSHFWAHEVLVVAHPVAVTADVDDVAVVQQTVDEGRRTDCSGSHFRPFPFTIR